MFKCAYCSGIVDYLDIKCPHCYADKPNWRLEIKDENDAPTVAEEVANATNSSHSHIPIYEPYDSAKLVTRIILGFILILVFTALWNPITSLLGTYFSDMPILSIIETVLPILILLSMVLFIVYSVMRVAE